MPRMTSPAWPLTNDFAMDKFLTVSPDIAEIYEELEAAGSLPQYSGLDEPDYTVGGIVLTGPTWNRISALLASRGKWLTNAQLRRMWSIYELTYGVREYDVVGLPVEECFSTSAPYFTQNLLTSYSEVVRSKLLQYRSFCVGVDMFAKLNDPEPAASYRALAISDDDIFITTVNSPNFEGFVYLMAVYVGGYVTYADSSEMLKYFGTDNFRSIRGMYKIVRRPNEYSA